MDPHLLARYDRPVPRYTSYPTAPHFSAAVGTDTYATWLRAPPAETALSLYVHIPFCDSLCWFCGCHMRVVNRYSSIRAYLEVLHREFDLVARCMATRQTVEHLHFGGGSPDILKPQDVWSLIFHLRDSFAFAQDAEIAVEIDPRAADASVIKAWAIAGATRASIGVQNFEPQVQQAINRSQSFECTGRVIDGLRSAGVAGINIDLLYGLPYQSVASVQRTGDRVVALAPDRIALFGYAHVPWLKPHQRLIDERALPDGIQRWQQFEAAATLLQDAGYTRIGLDHFAKPDNPLALASAAGRLRRNFQGYTTDHCETLIGFGASAISSLPQGYVQNLTGINSYAKAVRSDRPPVARGIAPSPDDRRRRAIIERLMCQQRVDLAIFDGGEGFAAEFDCLDAMAADGLLERDGSRIVITERGQPFMRAVCAVFDRYIGTGTGRHSRAI